MTATLTYTILLAVIFVFKKLQYAKIMRFRH